MLGRVSRSGGVACAGALSEAHLARGGVQHSSEADLARGNVQAGRGCHQGRDRVVCVFWLRGLVCVLHFLRN
jgi:hypothetical protein